MNEDTIEFYDLVEENRERTMESIFNKIILSYKEENGIQKSFEMLVSLVFRESERLCDTCFEYNKPKKDICIPVGNIKNPNVMYCSWWKEKLEGKIKAKKCSECREIKPIGEFYKRKNTIDGLQYWCKECVNKNDKKRWKNNAEKTRERNRKCYEKFN